MIKKLRTKLIMVSMFSLLIVLTVIIGVVNIVNYHGIVGDADSVLTLLMEGKGKFPEHPSDVNWRKAGPRFQSPELSYEARFFSVLLQEDGTILSTDIKHIAAVDVDTVTKYSQQAFAKKGDSGFVGNYRYMQYVEGDNVRIIFLDCGRMLAGFRAVLLNSTSISLFGLISVFLLVVLLSNRIIKPVSITYEKQKRFITDAGHEIKTPITIIDADTELLEMEIGKNEWLEDIRAQANRLSTLTNDLIYLSRMEEAEQMEMIDFPISDLIAETAASFQAPAITQNKRFTVHVQPMLTCHGNEKSICQLVTILLDNAVKYTNKEGYISLKLEKSGKSLILAIENSVDEISQETLDSMFDRFYRGDPSRSSHKKGYGIGLSIAQAVVNAHRGRILADSKDGHSLKITVSLPL